LKLQILITTIKLTFELTPIIDIMFDLYQKPRTFERFKEYIATLEGGKKGDLTLPIGGFNPMAKEHVMDKLRELKNLNAEQLIKDTLKELNDGHPVKENANTFKVALNLSDDLKGGWTNRYTSDYDSKFKINGIMNRNFCIPIFWSSENYTEQLIKNRTREYCYRTIYRLTTPKPETLEEHILQEKFVYEKSKTLSSTKVNFNELQLFYQKNKDTTDYVTIFNFLYGDEATASLGNKTLGISDEFAGDEFAKQLATKNIKI